MRATCARAPMTRLPGRTRDTVRLGALRRYSVYATVALLLGSGVLWLWLHWTRPEDELPSPLLAWSMKVHGAATMLFIYLVGTLLYGHMLAAWHRRSNRWSGALAAAAATLLVLTGYGLYYADGVWLRRGSEWLHWGVGIALAPVLWWHIAGGRRQRLPAAAGRLGRRRRF